MCLFSGGGQFKYPVGLSISEGQALFGGPSEMRHGLGRERWGRRTEVDLPPEQIPPPSLKPQDIHKVNTSSGNIYLSIYACVYTPHSCNIALNTQGV